MTGQNEQRSATGRIEREAFLKPNIHVEFHTLLLGTEPTRLNGSTASDKEFRSPNTIGHDTFGRGLMGVCLQTDAALQTIGSAFLIGPGVALTARHVVEKYSEFLREKKPTRGLMMAPFGREMFLWEPTSVTQDSQNDIAIIGLTPVSAPPSDGRFHKFPLTREVPKVGEKVRLFGIREEGYENLSSTSFGYAGEGNFFFSQGLVTNVFLEGRDKSILPGPCLEVGCGALSGMSGGLALDRRGYVVGVVSTSFGEQGPSYISLVNSVFELPFPILRTPAQSEMTTLSAELHQKYNPPYIWID